MEKGGAEKGSLTTLEKVLYYLIGLFIGVPVSLAIAFGMIDKFLSIRFIPLGITSFLGQIILFATFLAIVLAIVKAVIRKSDSSFLGKVLKFAVWLVVAIVLLVGAFGMISGFLSMRFVPFGISIFLGWMIVAIVFLRIVLTKKVSLSTTSGKVLKFLMGIACFIISLFVAFGMTDMVLSIRIPIGISVFFGWILVLTTTIFAIILGVVWITKQFVSR